MPSLWFRRHTGPVSWDGCLITLKSQSGIQKVYMYLKQWTFTCNIHSQILWWRAKAFSFEIGSTAWSSAVFLAKITPRQVPFQIPSRRVSCLAKRRILLDFNHHPTLFVYTDASQPYLKEEEFLKIICFSSLSKTPYVVFQKNNFSLHTQISSADIFHSNYATTKANTSGQNKCWRKNTTAQ